MGSKDELKRIPDGARSGIRAKAMLRHAEGSSFGRVRLNSEVEVSLPNRTSMEFDNVLAGG